MRELTYALRFKGLASPAGDDPKVLHASTTAPSEAFISKIGPGGISSEVHAEDGDIAMFESKVTITGDGVFREEGEITFAEGHSLRFTTVGEGHMGPSPAADVMHGAITWKVEGGEGQFEGSTGLITSNFTVDSQGKVVDNQYGVVWLNE